ncbi:MAG: aminodeoxychorismate synthase component I [Trichlorobacter sp.]|jgi:para-aminobenzoate synthetase/4-amino-4-deoxychorismate lyase
MIQPLARFDGWGSPGASWLFDDYRETLTAWRPEDVPAVLERAEAATERGLYAVGFVAYEAAQALNRSLPSLPPLEGLPLVWFALFSRRLLSTDDQQPPESEATNLSLTPQLGQNEHAAAVQQIHDAIADGQSYQINYTFSLSGDVSGQPYSLYQTLLTAQRPSFGALLDTGRHLIMSASPELFFQRQDGRITTRPMKGTAMRGRFPAEDRALARQLCDSAKEQAENLMIVDLLRNDLGQIAQTGSVVVDKLFELEQYPSVHQLTSSISALLQPETGLVKIMQALFPCGSVTGAPKRRSMELISDLEKTPRGIYCGAIGLLAPGGEAIFSVAIRTLLLDRETQIISMGVGSGITWDAQPAAEYAECLAKTAFVTAPPPPRLVESLLLTEGGYPLLERHLARLSWSAGRLGHQYSRPAAETLLLNHAATVCGNRKVRLLLAVDGQLAIESSPIEPDTTSIWLALAAQRVDPEDRSLYLKTEQRDLYDAARRGQPEADEIVLVNKRGELTEGSYHNLVLRLDNRLVTPPVACGLLPGVMREELLEQGTIVEQVLYPADLQRAEEIWLINGVRGWRRALLLHSGG